VGLTNLVKTGEAVRAGDRLCTVHARNDSHLDAVLEQISAAFEIGPQRTEPPPLVDELIE
jgi:thymidine phosphorylase